MLRDPIFNNEQVRDVRDTSESKGAGTFPKFLRRQKLSKERNCNADAFPSSAGGDDEQSFYNPADFGIGRTVNILNKEFFIYDMDAFTKTFYRDVMGESSVEGIVVDKLPPPVIPIQVSANYTRKGLKARP